MENEGGGLSGGLGLESALLDQRMRAEKHKTNFEALKAQHLILQDAHSQQGDELALLAGNYDRLVSRSQEIIQTLQSERDSKIVECEEQRAQVLTPVRLEQLKDQLLEECNRDNQKMVESLESQLEALGRECSELRYNYSFLKAEHGNVMTTHQTVLQELQAKHQTELNAYIEERKSFIARNERDIPTDVQRIRQLQRKNNDLQQKAKGLLAENEDLRGEREVMAALTEQSQQGACQEVAELKATVKTLQFESSAQSEQIVCLQGELGKARQELVSLNEQLALVHTQLDNTKRRLSEAEHEHSLELSQLKMKHLDVVRELEEGREVCVTECKALEAQLEAQGRSIEARDSLLADKERQCESRVTAAREREWEKQVLLDREKVELEGAVASLQQELSQSREGGDARVVSLEDKVRQLSTAKSGLESELELLRSQLSDKTNELQSVMMEMKQIAGVSRKYQSLLSEHRKLESLVTELRESKLSTEDSLREVQTRGRGQGETFERVRDKLTQDLHTEKTLWERERDGLLGKLKDCESSKQSLEQQLTASKATNKKLQKHYKKQIIELESSAEVLRAQQERATTEKQALQSSLKLENQRLQRKLSNILRSQKEFQFLLHNQPQTQYLSFPQHLESTQDTDNLDTCRE
ncbi:centrosomal protein of 83 kDa-like [Halichondria panicea]|uniref:centrosomal protein of 83 kDa-like n=1 Tax=Halichondria panicea TaxID=6063 RepID=UPI00312BAE55